MGDKKKDDAGKGGTIQWKTISGKEGVMYREHPTRRHGRTADRCLSIRYRTGDGKRHHESLGWTSQGWTIAHAVSLLRELKENIRLGLRPQSLREKREMAMLRQKEEERQASMIKAGELTFGYLAERYREWANRNRKSAHLTSQLLDDHILPVLGDMRAVDITSQDIARLQDIVSKKRPQTGRGLSDPKATLAVGTVLHILKTVREVFNFALETPIEGQPGVMLFTGANPARISKRGRGVRLPRYDSRRLRVLNDDEIHGLLSYALRNPESTDIHDMILFSLDTGVRAGELASIRRESVDAETGTVRILTGGVGSDRSTKGGATRLVRVGRLFPECLAMLRWRLSLPAFSPYLFPGRGGGPRRADCLSRVMDRLMQKLGYNDGVTDPRNRVVWHTLRHTFATRMLESGVDIYTLKVLMGHHSVTTTEVYLHLCDPDKRRRALAEAERVRASELR